jgi:hypothetical protein
MAKPGNYRVRLTAGGKSQTQPFDLRINPTETWTKADTDARFDLWMKVRATTEAANQAVIAARATVARLKERVDGGGGGAQAKELLVKIEASELELENNLIPVGKTLVQIANEPAKLLPKLQTVSHMLYSSEGRPPASAYAVYESLTSDIRVEIDGWNDVVATDVAELNRLLER